ncbi:MAG: hypothetical protein JNL95_09405 [Chitinophagales bacterium]|nr:hypothetical protein [Chitinophagales bacterium]
MKRMLFFVCFSFSILIAKAQDLPNFRYIRIVEPSDFNESTDKAALQAADYILSIPPSPKNKTWASASDYLLNWMAGTPKYTFTLDETGTALIKKDANILLVYMATMVKTQLEDTATLKDAKQLKIKAIKRLIAYAQIPTNNIKISGELKKMIELNNKGELEEYLKR